MPVLFDEDELLGDFADVTLTEEDDEDWPLPQPKRTKLDQIGSATESTDFSLQSERDHMVIDLTSDGEDESVHDQNGRPELSQTSGPQAEPVPPTNFRIQVKPSISNYPRSLCDDWQPPLAPTPEGIALNELLGHVRPVGSEYTMIPIRQFRIYRPPGKSLRKMDRQHEMEPLHRLQTQGGCDTLLVDGLIAHNRLERYLEKVPFSRSSIDGYDDATIHTVKRHISIQSLYAKEVWYLLQDPAPDYAPYHRPFQWVADFAKYFVDYLSEHEIVELSHFRSRFHEWASKRHGHSHEYQQWVKRFSGQNPRSDFRQAVVSYAPFLWKEAYDGPYALIESSGGEIRYRIKPPSQDPVWEDMNFSPTGDTPEHEKSDNGKTLVTPFVYSNFQNITPLKEFFEIKEPSSRRVRADIEKRKRILGFTNAQHAQVQTSAGPFLKKAQLKTGDFVAVHPDDATLWKDGAEVWYAYIQSIRQDCHGQLFDVIWMYPASATTLAGARYPFQNELFLSSHCNCDEAPLRIKDIAGKVNISWLKRSFTGTPHFFIRQKFDTEHHCFTTIKASDFVCQCRAENSVLDEVLGKVSIGDTVLVPFSRSGELPCRRIDSYGSSDKISDTLEPMVVENYLQQSQTILVRRLIRRDACREGRGAKPNEMVWTDDFFEIYPELVGPKCHVRFFEEGEKIPSPYNRGGIGNCWYITKRLTLTGKLERLGQPFPTGLNEGLDPTIPPPRQKLVGLDLFSGGGNFGRGLEEGMAVNFLYAIDYAKNAVTTYRANCSSDHACWTYWGTVDDYLKHVMDGNSGHHFATIGDIDFIAAGTPCQGFSDLQQKKGSPSSLRNISMVASVAAYIDVYRPKYAILENVAAMAQRGKEELGIFPQLLCTLVGMGYQVSQHLLDSWSTGDSQKRTRLFVFIAAPGLVSMPPATLTHSHPPGTSSRSLGNVKANDQKFGERRFMPTPFQYVSAQQSMGDLPDIQDSHVQTCIEQPDHRTVNTHAAWTRSMIRHVPVHPPLQGAMDAIRAGVMPQALAERFLKTAGKRKDRSNKSWSRIPRDGLTSTITTAPAAACSRGGRALHYQQHRVLSIREARRVQGFDDEDIITGSPAAQWRIIGNSVSRSTALALGMALQEAWLASPPENRSSNAGNEDSAIPDSKESSPDWLSRLPSNVERPRPRQRVAVVIDLTQDD